MKNPKACTAIECRDIEKTAIVKPCKNYLLVNLKNCITFLLFSR